MGLLEEIAACARIPSFSTYEDRLHAFIYQYLSDLQGTRIYRVYDNNLVIKVPGRRRGKPVAITSHLDKINHFGSSYPLSLDVTIENGRITGQMDDAVGVAICLNLIRMAYRKKWPELIFLFSEMEESYGLRNHPHLLKNNGRDVEPQIGAKRLCAYLHETKIEPAVFLTIDTTPIFKGESGIALYTEHWEKTGVMPDAELKKKIETIKTFFLRHNADLRQASGNNDYLEYGRFYGTPERGNAPSIAIEPAIFPYHQIGEGVFVENVVEIVRLIDLFLHDFDFTFSDLNIANET